jgi:uncharacterized protein (DUF488 family)
MPIVYTIGHSNRSLEEFVKLLMEVKASIVVDVRRWPSSRRLPHFSKDNLREALGAIGIRYFWAPELGGYRRFGVDVPSDLEAKAPDCLESSSFKAYYVYVRVDDKARERIEWIARLAEREVLVIMCRERIPWRCHRKLISDLLVERGVKVVHIIDGEHSVEHRIPECRRLYSV